MSAWVVAGVNTVNTKASQLLQKAGQSLHNAVQALEAANLLYANQVPKALATNPFALETEQMMDAWRTCSRLTQELGTMDSRLKDLFGQVVNSPEVETVPLLTLLAAPSKTKPTDIRVKSLKPAKTVKVIKATRVVKVKKASAKKVRVAGKLPGNAEKLFSHLKTVLNTETFVHLVQSHASKAAGIPNGSIAASLNRLLELKLVTEGNKGEYKLAA
jgi:hypothetical protein